MTRRRLVAPDALSVAVALIAAVAGAVPLRAEPEPPAAGATGSGLALVDTLLEARDALEADGWLVHGQTTYIQQGHPGFRSPYTAATV